MVSEDSQDLGWFSEIHRLLNLSDFDDSVDRQVTTLFHQLDYRCELLKILLLRSSEWVFLEEWNDVRADVVEPLHAISEEILPMIVVSTVSKDFPAPEELNEFLKYVPAGFALNNCNSGRTCHFKVILEHR